MEKEEIKIEDFILMYKNPETRDVSIEKLESLKELRKELVVRCAANDTEISGILKEIFFTTKKPKILYSIILEIINFLDTSKVNKPEEYENYINSFAKTMALSGTNTFVFVSLLRIFKIKKKDESKDLTDIMIDLNTKILEEALRIEYECRMVVEALEVEYNGEVPAEVSKVRDACIMNLRDLVQSLVEISVLNFRIIVENVFKNIIKTNNIDYIKLITVSLFTLGAAHFISYKQQESDKREKDILEEYKYHIFNCLKLEPAVVFTISSIARYHAISEPGFLSYFLAIGGGIINQSINEDSVQQTINNSISTGNNLDRFDTINQIYDSFIRPALDSEIVQDINSIENIKNELAKLDGLDRNNVPRLLEVFNELISSLQSLSIEVKDQFGLAFDAQPYLEDKINGIFPSFGTILKNSVTIFKTNTFFENDTLILPKIVKNIDNLEKNIGEFSKNELINEILNDFSSLPEFVKIQLSMIFEDNQQLIENLNENFGTEFYANIKKSLEITSEKLAI